MALIAQVDAIVTRARFAAKRTDMVQRLEALRIRLVRERAFAARAPCFASSHEVWRALDVAHSAVESALAVVRAEATREHD